MSEKFAIDKNVTKEEQEHLSSLKIRLEDGTTRCMVERKGMDIFGRWVYRCYPCATICLGKIIMQHVSGKKHKKKLSHRAVWPTQYIFNQNYNDVLDPSAVFQRCTEAIVSRNKKQDLYKKNKKMRNVKSHIQETIDGIKHKDDEKHRFEPYPYRDLSPYPKYANSKMRFPNYKNKIQLAKKKHKTIMCAMEKTYAYFKKYPEEHPMYAEEWSNFWRKRYIEILSKGRDPSKHDFQSEWIVFWVERMKELHNEKVKYEIEAYRNLCVSPPDLLYLDGKQISSAPGRKSPVSRHWSSEQKRSDMLSPRSADVRTTEARRGSVDDIRTEDKRQSREIRRRKAKRLSQEQSISPIPRPRYSDIGRKEAKRRSPDIRRPEARRLSPDGQWPRSSARYSSGFEYDDRCPERRTHASRRSPPWPDRSRSRTPVQRDNLSTWDSDSGDYSAGSLVGSMTPQVSGAPDKSAAALRLVMALEDCFGSDGSKVVDLLAQAINVKNAKTNSYEEQLEQRAHNAIPMRQETDDYTLRTQWPPVEEVDRAQIAQQVTEALVSQGKTNVSIKELAQIVDTVVAMAEAKRRAIARTHNLTDSELEMLLKNSNELLAEEKQGLIEFLKRLAVKEPARVERLSQSLTEVTSNKNQNGPKSLGTVDVITNGDDDVYDSILEEISKFLDEVPITLFDK